MDESALLIWKAKAGGGIPGLQGRLLNARLSEVCERLVDECEGFRPPLPRTGGFERVERGIEWAARKRRWCRGHQLLLVDMAGTRRPFILRMPAALLSEKRRSPCLFPCRKRCAQAQDVADGEGELGAVERVEVEFLDPGGAQQPALLGGDGGCDQRAQLRVFVRPLEEAGKPVGHCRPAHPGEAFHLGVVGDRQDTGHNGH
jgi:hypothetical protein